MTLTWVFFLEILDLAPFQPINELGQNSLINCISTKYKLFEKNLHKMIYETVFLFLIDHYNFHSYLENHTLFLSQFYFYHLKNIRGLKIQKFRLLLK